MRVRGINPILKSASPETLLAALRTGAANVGDFAGASVSYAKALAIKESLTAARLKDVNLRLELMRDYFRVCGALGDTGDFEDELHALQRDQALVGSLSGVIDDRQQQFNMAGIHFYPAAALDKTGDLIDGSAPKRQS